MNPGSSVCKETESIFSQIISYDWDTTKDPRPKDTLMGGGLINNHDTALPYRT